jgi:hypothetical protein
MFSLSTVLPFGLIGTIICRLQMSTELKFVVVGDGAVVCK